MGIKKLIVLCVVGTCLLIPNCSNAWNDTAHILIAKIASQNLNPGVMEQIVNLAEDIDGEFPPPFDFEFAACWANDISTCGLRAFDSWHEKLIPYDPSGVLTKEKRKHYIESIEKNCVSVALTEAMGTLQNPTSGAWEKNFMLRILLHCVGDIHQPLYCAALYSHDFPSGDHGGKLFTINGRTEKNLRDFWDNLAGNHVRSCGWMHDQTYEEMVEMDLLLEEIVTLFPLNSFAHVTENDFNAISEESYELATQFAYQNIIPGENLSQEYVTTARKIAYRQIALAGYRLANFLNEVFVD